jgi:hypothetical protein
VTTTQTNGLDHHFAATALKDLIALMGQRAFGDDPPPWDDVELVVWNATALLCADPEAVTDAVWIGANGRPTRVMLKLHVTELTLDAFAFSPDLYDLALWTPDSAVEAFALAG